MKKTDHCIMHGIMATNVRGLIEIAGTAGQCPVCSGVLAPPGDRHDMFHLQRKVEHGFGGMAILTTMTSPQCHLSIM
jgi:hypothetical protein